MGGIVTHTTPLLSKPAPCGRPVDRLIAALATVGLVASVGTTLWFFLGFAETDPSFAPASSAFLLSMLLGAFAIIPCAVILRQSWSAWQTGFRLSYGFWALFLVIPWIGVACVSARSEWMPFWLTLGPLFVAIPTALWAAASIILDRLPSKTR